MKTRKITANRSKENTNAKTIEKLTKHLNGVLGAAFRDIDHHAEINSSMWKIIFTQEEIKILDARRKVQAARWQYWSLPWWRRICKKEPV